METQVSNIIESAQYQEEVDELVEDARVKGLAALAPAGTVVDLDDWGFTRWSQERFRELGIGFRYIGSPSRALAQIINNR